MEAFDAWVVVDRNGVPATQVVMEPGYAEDAEKVLNGPANLPSVHARKPFRVQPVTVSAK